MPALTPDRARHRAALASATHRQRRNPDDPDAAAQREEAARAYWSATLEQYVREVLSKAPPLTEAQRQRLAALLVTEEVTRHDVA